MWQEQSICLHTSTNTGGKERIHVWSKTHEETPDYIYCKENYTLLQILLCEQLTKCKLTLQQYMCLMEGTPTCGYEITLLILSQMFNIAILVIHSDFLWVSTQVPPRECPVVIIQNTSGKFLGTKSTVWCSACQCWYCSKNISKQKEQPCSCKKFDTGWLLKKTSTRVWQYDQRKIVSHTGMW